MSNEVKDREVFAVISHALHLEISRNMHDMESYKLTIKRRNNCSSWGLKTDLMRKLPR